MIIVPELKTVVILVPRTGSGSLRRALLARYPGAMQIYRHMEADGIPIGYDRWSKVGVIRDPVDRLWSLYKFLAHFAGDHDPAYIAAMRGSVDMPFSDWLVRNETVFTSPYDRAGHGRYWPEYTVRHPLPENKKSQYLTLRPDLGTTIVPYSDLATFAQRLDVTLTHHNATGADLGPPPLTEQAVNHLARFFEWDFTYFRDAVAA